MDHRLLKKHRRYQVHMSSINSTVIEKQNPWVPTWWSAAFPGAGQIMMGFYIKGFILFSWEFFINITTNLNLAIYYSFLGRFEMAKQVLDTRWILLYMPIYVAGIWDSYRLSVELNNLVRLIKKEKPPISIFKLTSLGVNFHDKRNPVISAIWSIITPGLGHLHINRLPTGFFLLIWSIASIYFSKVLPGIHFTLLGQFDQAIQVINKEWVIFLPSIYGFGIYDSYRQTINCNNMFKQEQTQYFKKEFQNKNFKMPL